MTQQIKVLATKTYDPSSNPWDPNGEREEPTPKSCPLTSTEAGRESNSLELESQVVVSCLI